MSPQIVKSSEANAQLAVKNASAGRCPSRLRPHITPDSDIKVENGMAIGTVWPSLASAKDDTMPSHSEQAQREAGCQCERAADNLASP